MRASAVVNRPSTLPRRWFRSSTHRWTFSVSISGRAIRRDRHCHANTLNSISALFNQLPCLGV